MWHRRILNRNVPPAVFKTHAKACCSTFNSHSKSRQLPLLRFGLVAISSPFNFNLQRTFYRSFKMAAEQIPEPPQAEVQANGTSAKQNGIQNGVSNGDKPADDTPAEEQPV